MDAYPGTRELRPREADTLLFHQVTYPEKTCRMIDVTQGIERCRPFMDYFECTTPSQRVWLTHRARFMTGLEALRCQGICYGERGDDIARIFPRQAPRGFGGERLSHRLVLGLRAGGACDFGHG